MATKNIDIVVNAKDNASRAFESIWSKIKNSLNTISIISWTVSAWLIALWKSAVSNAIKRETATTTMETMLKNTWHSSDEAIESLENLIKTQWRLWVVSSSVSLAAAKQFATFDMWAEAISTILPAFNDYIAWEKWMNATTEDAINLANGLAKAMQGNFSSLTKAWRVIDEETASLIANWNELERAQGLVQVLNSTYWWLNETLAQTTEARLQKVNNMFWSIKSQLWEALIPVVEKFLEIMETKVIPVIDNVAKWIDENPELSQSIITITASIAWLTFAISTLVPRITSIITLISWPAWIVIAIWALLTSLYMLSENTLTTQDQIVLYEQELENLRIAYENWSITIEEYIVKTQELEAKIAEAEARHRTLWGYLKDNFIWTLRSIFHPMDENNWWLRAWIDLLKMLFEWIWTVSERITNVFIKAIDSAVQKLKELRNMMKKVWVDMWNAVSSAWNSTTSRISSKIQGFATGWSVRWNVPILVWERWPELFVPSSNWNIIPNEDLNWWNITLNVNLWWVAVNNWWDEMALAEMIASTITRELELYKKGIY